MKFLSARKFYSQYLSFLKSNLKSSKGSQTHFSLGLSGVGSFSDDSEAALTDCDVSVTSPVTPANLTDMSV